MHEE